MALPEMDEVKDAALKYDKKALAKMVQMGQLSHTVATMAAMMRDRIVLSEMKPPEKTVTEEVLPLNNTQMAGLAAVPVREEMFQETMTGATGGLVAMAGGGDVPRYQNRGFVESVDEYGVVDYQQPRGNILSGIGETFSRFLRPDVRKDELLRKLGYTTQQINAMSPETQDMVISKSLAPNAASDTGGVPVATATAEQPTFGTKPPAGLPAAAAAPRAPAPGIAGLDEYRKAEEERIKAMESAVGEPSTIAKEAERQREINKAMGVDPDFFKNQARELVQQREELKGDRKEAANMRLLEAGLNILGGTSPYAFENIGKGASKALAGFADDLKDIKKQTRELEKARKEVLAAEQMAARSDSANISARLDRSRDKVEAKEAALRDAKVEAKKTLVEMGFKERNLAATEMSARAQMKSAERPRSSGKAPDYLDVVKLAKEMVPAGQVWEGLTEEQRRALEVQAEEKIKFYAQGMGPSALSQILDPTFQAALRRNQNLGK
jgi:hypothetical protein